MSKSLGESKIISIQHKSLIGTGSGDERGVKSGLVGGKFISQMSVSDKKIRTLERNRNISPAPFQVDSTDTDDEVAPGSDKFSFENNVSVQKSQIQKGPIQTGSIQKENQKKLAGLTQIGSNNCSLNSQSASHNLRTSVSDQEPGMVRSVSKEIRSAFSLTTGKLTDKNGKMPAIPSSVILPSLISSNGAIGSNTINPSKSLQVLNTCQVTNKRSIAKVLGQTASNHSTSNSAVTPSTTTSSSQNTFSSTSSEENDKCQTKFTTRKGKIEPYNSLPEFATLPVQYVGGYGQIQKPKPKYPDEYDTDRNLDRNMNGNVDRNVDRNAERNVTEKHTNDSIYNFLTYESVDLKWKYQRYLGNQQNLTESVKNQNHKGLISRGLDPKGQTPQKPEPHGFKSQGFKLNVKSNSPTNSNNFENKYFANINKNFENNSGKPKHQPDQTQRQTVKLTRSNNSSGSNSSSSWENYTFLYPGTKPQNYTQHARASRQSTITFGESKMLQDCFSKLTCRNDTYSVQGPISVSVVREMVNKTPENSYGSNVKVYDVAVGREHAQKQAQEHAQTQAKNRQFQFNSEEMHFPPQQDYKTLPNHSVSGRNFSPNPPSLARSVKNSSPTPSNRLSDLTRNNNNNYPVHRLPSVVERFMQESLQSADFRECKVLQATEPSLLDQHMAAIGMDEFEQFFDRDQAKRETHDIYRKDIYKNRQNCEAWAVANKKENEKKLSNRCEMDNTCSSDSDSMMVRECKHGNDKIGGKVEDKEDDKEGVQHCSKVDLKVSSKALESRSRQPSPISSDYSEKSEVGSRDLALLAQWSEEYGEHIATKMLGTLMTMRDNNQLTSKPVC